MRTQQLKVTITIEIEADPHDDEAVQEAVYSFLSEMMEDEVLDFQISPADDDDEPIDEDET